MKLGIIGLEQSGKTTVFNALTGANKEVGTYGKIEAHIATINVPDERVDWLGEFYKREKTVHAHIEFIDIPGSINDTSDPKIVAAARETDALVYVVRVFENPNVPHPHETVNPLRDYGYITMGLIMADMSLAENRIEKIKTTFQKAGKKKEDELELAVLEKIMAQFEVEEPASETELTDQEKKLVSSFQFMTLKPSLALLNISEDALKAKETTGLLAQVPNSMAMCADLEAELRRLEETDRNAYMKNIGMEDLSLDSFIRKAQDTLGLISFFTVGKNEVRAWTIPRGTPAHAAAGKIHTDMERGFIRAEVFSYEDLKTLGDEQSIRHAGKFRLEGKDYIVQDGDILFIKFNV
ncbi:MAG: redox-regulated ATPase YchF [Candidatus Omnitrophota bacterium]